MFLNPISGASFDLLHPAGGSGTPLAAPDSGIDENNLVVPGSRGIRNCVNHPADNTFTVSHPAHEPVDHQLWGSGAGITTHSTKCFRPIFPEFFITYICNQVWQMVGGNQNFSWHECFSYITNPNRNIHSPFCTIISNSCSRSDWLPTTQQLRV